MFTAHCPRHDRAVLLPEQRIRSLTRSDDGFELTWTCWCGEEGTSTISSTVMVGRHRPCA